MGVGVGGGWAIYVIHILAIRYARISQCVEAGQQHCMYAQGVTTLVGRGCEGSVTTVALQGLSG